MSREWKKLCEAARETALLQSTQALLEWDERTRLPASAGEYRADQITFLAGEIHRRQTSAELGEWLNELAGTVLATDPHSNTGATIRELRREYDRRVKLPQTLVEQLVRASVLGQQAWVAARENDDFASFQPHLEELVHLKRMEAEAIGFENDAYDALLDEYEPEARTADVSLVLKQLADASVPLIHAIKERGQQPPLILKRRYPKEAQRQFGLQAAAAIGFDFQRGRLDETHHPFCTEMGPNDCRITTRYDERFFSTAFFGTLHEAGHGIYEQGLRREHYGLPPGRFASLGIHESQSRLWENFVGRSRAFWQHFFPLAQNAFPDALADVSLDDFYFAVNDVRPSLIRVEADEATYNLHIIIRFELEQALIAGDLMVADLPRAWNAKYVQYLDVEPPSDADGVLQDIHWSGGAIGYFPTYSLGNLYAAQLFKKAQEELGDLNEQFTRAEFSPLRDWLKVNIHEPGQCYPAAELVQRVTGEPLSHVPLVEHLFGKLGPLYGA